MYKLIMTAVLAGTLFAGSAVASDHKEDKYKDKIEKDYKKDKKSDDDHKPTPPPTPTPTPTPTPPPVVPTPPPVIPTVVPTPVIPVPVVTVTPKPEPEVIKPTPTPVPTVIPDPEPTKPAVVKPVNISTTVYFSTNSAVLSGSEKKKLRDVILAIKKHKFTSVSISGHTDARNGMNGAMKLATDRANSAKAYIQSYLPNIKITISAHGPLKPAALSNTKSGLAKNRRAEVTVS